MREADKQIAVSWFTCTAKSHIVDISIYLFPQKQGEKAVKSSQESKREEREG